MKSEKITFHILSASIRNRKKSQRGDKEIRYRQEEPSNLSPGRVCNQANAEPQMQNRMESKGLGRSDNLAKNSGQSQICERDEVDRAAQYV